jgi:LPXTG-site transpeptidase (sortase) family protein
MSRGILKWLQWLLFAIGFAALGYCAFVLTDSWSYQRRENAALERLLPGEDSPATGVARDSRLRKPDELVGRLEVKRLGLSVMVAEGTDTPTMAHAAGHISGTALPGEAGNVGIAAHRDTFFRRLRNIRKNDVISITTPAGRYRYRVVWTDVVSPDHVSVLDSDGTDLLTLVTCYPFSFIGSAPDRFVVRANQISGPLQPEALVAHPRL